MEENTWHSQQHTDRGDADSTWLFQRRTPSEPRNVLRWYHWTFRHRALASLALHLPFGHSSGPRTLSASNPCWYPGQGTTMVETNPRTVVQERMTPKFQGCFLTTQVPILARLEHSDRMDEASSSQTSRGQNFIDWYSPNSRLSVIFNGRRGYYTNMLFLLTLNRWNAVTDCYLDCHTPGQSTNKKANSHISFPESGKSSHKPGQETFRDIYIGAPSTDQAGKCKFPVGFTLCV